MTIHPDQAHDLALEIIGWIALQPMPQNSNAACSQAAALPKRNMCHGSRCTCPSISVCVCLGYHKLSGLRRKGLTNCYTIAFRNHGLHESMAFKLIKVDTKIPLKYRLGQRYCLLLRLSCFKCILLCFVIRTALAGHSLFVLCWIGFLCWFVCVLLLRLATFACAFRGL